VEAEGGKGRMKVFEVRYNREVIVAFDNPDEANQKADYLSELFDDNGYKVVEVEKEPII
jgi:recombinational DNA repair protein RecR